MKIQVENKNANKTHAGCTINLQRTSVGVHFVYFQELPEYLASESLDTPEMKSPGILISAFIFRES